MSGKPTTPPPKTISQMFPDKWLRAADLRGKSVLVTLKKVTVESVYNKREKSYEWKTILDSGKSKRLILNKTQCEEMEIITGTEIFKDWKGQSIILSPAIAKNKKPTIKISSPKRKKGIDKQAVKAVSRITSRANNSEEE